MSAVVHADLTGGRRPAGVARPDGTHSPLEEALVLIAGSERALDDVLERERRRHRSNIAHEPSRCVLCFLEGRP